MRVRGQHALHADVGDIGQRVGGGDAVSAAVVGVGVVDVVARGHHVGGAELVVETPDHDVAVKHIAAAAGEVVGVGGGARAVRQREVAHGRQSDRVEALGGNHIVRERLAGGGGGAGRGIVDEYR